MEIRELKSGLITKARLLASPKARKKYTELLLEAANKAGANGILKEALHSKRRSQTFTEQTCEALSLLNGMEAVCPGSTDGLDANELRDTVAKKNPFSIWSPGSFLRNISPKTSSYLLAQELIERGNIKHVGAFYRQKPIELVEKLFGEPGRFMCAAAFNGLHARVIVPLAKPTKDKFVKVIDSLDWMPKRVPKFIYAGAESTWSVDKFLKYLNRPTVHILQNNSEEVDNIYEVIKPR